MDTHTFNSSAKNCRNNLITFIKNNNRINLLASQNEIASDYVVDYIKNVCSLGAMIKFMMMMTTTTYRESQDRRECTLTAYCSCHHDSNDFDVFILITKNRQSNKCNANSMYIHLRRNGLLI